LSFIVTDIQNNRKIESNSNRIASLWIEIESNCEICVNTQPYYTLK